MRIVRSSYITVFHVIQWTRYSFLANTRPLPPSCLDHKWGGKANPLGRLASPQTLSSCIPNKISATPMWLAFGFVCSHVGACSDTMARTTRPCPPHHRTNGEEGSSGQPYELHGLLWCRTCICMWICFRMMEDMFMHMNMSLSVVVRAVISDLHLTCPPFTGANWMLLQSSVHILIVVLYNILLIDWLVDCLVAW